MKFLFSLGEDAFFTPVELVLRRDVADGTVQSALIIMPNVVCHNAAGIG